MHYKSSILVFIKNLVVVKYNHDILNIMLKKKIHADDCIKLKIQLL